MFNRQAFPRPDLEFHRKLAKRLVKVWRDDATLEITLNGESTTLNRSWIASRLPRLARKDADRDALSLSDAQFLLARELGHPDWPTLVRVLESGDPARRLLAILCPVGAGNPAPLQEARDLIANHPEVNLSIHAAAALGDAEAVRRGIEANPKAHLVKGGPHGWEPLTYLCFSRLYHEARDRRGFLESARLLLEGGADAKAGYNESAHVGRPVWESVLYAASGLARDAEMTRLLLQHGADPNDEETPYHAPESYDNACVSVLIESGKMNVESLSTLLLRKLDWHDFQGAKMALDAGADPNFPSRWNVCALHQALRRDNALTVVELLLERGADPFIVSSAEHGDSFWIAARRGRGDVLELLERRGHRRSWEPAEQVLADCALGRQPASIPAEARPLISSFAGQILAWFAGNDNARGLECLVRLGLPVDAVSRGDGYFQVPPGSTALQVAAWRGRHEAVKSLLALGADPNRRDANRRTPLMLAVRACTESHWAGRRTLDSIEALLEAGADPSQVNVPTGYPEADALLGDRL